MAFIFFRSVSTLAVACFGAYLILAVGGAQAASLTAERAELVALVSQPQVARLIPTGVKHGVINGSDENLPHVAQWLDWVVNTPERLGKVSYRNEPLIAGETTSLRVEYTVGTRLPEGSTLALLTQWTTGITLQSADSRKENYVAVGLVNGQALKPVAVPAITSFSSWYDEQLTLGFEVKNQDLEVGDRIEFVVSNLVLPRQAGLFSLPVAFSEFPSRQLMMGKVEALEVSPADPDFIEVIAPSRLGRGSTIDVPVVVRDQFGNPSRSATRELDVLVDGKFLRRIGLDGAFSSIEDLQFAQAGLHTIEVRAGGGRLRGTSNPIVVQSGDKQIAWLDIAKAQLEQGSIKPSRLSAGDSTQVRRRTLEQGGAYLSFDNSLADVALPFVPMDVRGSKVNGLSLVQIAAGESQFEWFAQRFFDAGYRVGVSAGSYSPLPVDISGGRTPLTAVLGRSSEAKMRVLNQGLSQLQRQPIDEAGSSLLKANTASYASTYATTGAKMVVHSVVNGSALGGRAKANKRREISGWVQGTGPIDRIELVKNGTLAGVKSISGSPSSKVLKVSVKSSSEPFKSQRDLPRNAREWIGFIRSSLTEVTVLPTPKYSQSAKHAIAQNGTQRVDFITWTHGGWSSFLVELGDVSEEDVIELNLRGGFEESVIKPKLRAPSQIPATRQMVPVYELADGAVTRELEVNGYKDIVRFELVDTQAANYIDFVFNDVAPFAQEDYYYLRVIQLDDQVAWTSPVFVGGFDAP